jgi:AcrR family transcriptional regulator
VEGRLGDTADAQRARLLDAVARVVAERGFAAATVSDIVSAARVSRSTFYALFESKERCFLEAYRHGVDVMLGQVREAVRDAAGGWRAQLRAGVRAYLATLAADPGFARAYLLEVHAAGPHALDARAEALRRFADRYLATFAQARAAAGELPEPPPGALLVLTAGTEQLASEYVRAGRTDELPELEAVFCRCAESVLSAGPPPPAPAAPGAGIRSDGEE